MWGVPYFWVEKFDALQSNIKNLPDWKKKNEEEEEKTEFNSTVKDSTRLICFKKKKKPWKK